MKNNFPTEEQDDAKVACVAIPVEQLVALKRKIVEEEVAWQGYLKERECFFRFLKFSFAVAFAVALSLGFLLAKWIYAP